MNARTVLTSALACAVALGLTGPSAAQVKAKERCFAAGTCKQMKGISEEEARALMAAK
jgi:hypothetical protein